MATNTAASFTNHTGNGTAGPFNISFSYLSEAEVDVTVGGVLKTITTHYTFTSATQITFTSGNEPANGVAIKFQRDTNISAKKVDFADGSVLTEADLDANSDQVLFAQQEIIDKLGGIEEGATGDQTAAEIRTLVESASDSNVFTDADHSKLNAIEASATADQTASEIRTLVENASDSNVFTDADHTKLNGIEANATADQTASEIRTLVESASDSNVFTDADHTKLNGIEAGATADQTVTEIKSLIASSPLDASHLAANSVDSSELVDGSVDTSHLSADCVDGTKIADNAIGSEHLQANSVTTSEIADAELTTLAGMQSGTASKLADSTALTSDIADLNQLDGMAKQTTITDDDTKFPTSGAVVDFVAAQIAPLGGLEVVATDAAFPNTQPSAGVVISISDAGGVAFNGSGTSTTARTVGGSTVTINNAPSTLNNETLVAGVGLMVSSTGSGQIYNYHKILGKEDDIKQLSDDINDFNARYRVGSSNPTSALDAGDLFFNTSTSKLLVYNATNSAWEEAQSIGNFFISTLSPAFDGSTQDFTITNAPANAQQILLSINGVVQKPNSGTSTPSEGFALSGSTIKLAAAPASGSDYFAVVLGSTVNIGTPSNNTVNTAILQNGSVTTAKIVDDAITGEKLANNLDIPDGNKIRFGTDNDLQIYHDGSDSYISNVGTGELIIQPTTNEIAAVFRTNGSVELFHDNVKKFETTSTGVNISGSDTTGSNLNGDLVINNAAGTRYAVFDASHTKLNFSDNASITLGNSNDFIAFHDSSGHTFLQDQGNGALRIRSDSEVAIQKWDGSTNENMAKFVPDGAVELYHDNVKRVETTSDGATVTGFLTVNSGNLNNALFLNSTDGDVNLGMADNAGGCRLLQAGGNLRIRTGGNANVFGTGDNERMVVTSTGNILIGTTTEEDTTGNSGPKIIHTGDLQIDGDQKSLLFRSTNSTAQKQSGIQWWNENGAGVQCAIFGIREASSQAPTTLAFYTTNNVDTSSNGGQGNITNQMVINSEGEVRIQHEGSSDAVVSSDEVHAIGNSSLNTVTSNLARLCMQERSGNWISFRVSSGGHYGTISQSGSGVSYGSNSDYRLKDNVANLTGGIAFVKQLRPVTFNWNDLSGLSKTETHQGFIAHEVQALVPDAVDGEKDGMDIWGDCTDSKGNVTQTHVPESKKKDGETWTKKGEDIRDQQLDTGKLIPILTAAIKSLISKVEVLETEVAGLKAA